MGRKIDEATGIRALEFVAKGNSVRQVALRLGISAAFTRKAVQREQERLAINQEVPADEPNAFVDT